MHLKSGLIRVVVLLEGDYCKLLEWLFVSLKLETKNIEGNLRVATRFTIFLFVVRKHKDRVYNLRVATRFTIFLFIVRKHKDRVYNLRVATRFTIFLFVVRKHKDRVYNLRVATRFTIFLFVVRKHKDRVYNLRVATSQQFTNRWTKSDVDSSRLGELRKLGHKTK